MFAHTTTTENAIEFEPVVHFDDFDVSIEFTSTLAVNLSREEFDLLTFAIRTGYAEHLERTAELDRQLDAKFGRALTPADPEPIANGSMGGLSAVVFGAERVRSFRVAPRRRARCNQHRGLHRRDV